MYEDYDATASRGAVDPTSGACDAADLRQYTYRRGEAIVFTSQFYHSTEPGCSLEEAGEPHVYLCFTFGTDRPELYDRAIAPTISGYQSRLLVDAGGSMRLTELGQYLRDTGDERDRPLER